MGRTSAPAALIAAIAISAAPVPSAHRAPRRTFAYLSSYGRQVGNILGAKDEELSMSCQNDRKRATFSDAG
jgi:hypothetical protein